MRSRSSATLRGSTSVPDCGLRTRSWDVAYEKLQAMVEGTRLAEEALNRAHASA